FFLERWSALLTHGVAALIAVRREQRTTAAQHLRNGLALPVKHVGDRENQDFLVAAHALSLEQGGQTGQAMARLAQLLPRRDNEMTLGHQWLPHPVRLPPAPPPPPCAATGSWSPTPPSSPRQSPTTGQPAPPSSCPPRWKTSPP